MWGSAQEQAADAIACILHSWLFFFIRNGGPVSGCREAD